jgi:arylsulfatase A-like enzyme
MASIPAPPPAAAREAHASPSTDAPDAGRIGAGRVVASMAWFALVGALLQLLALAIVKYGMGRVVEENPQVVWMAPVALLATLALPALALAVGARLRPRLVTRRVVVWIGAFLAALNVALMYQRFHAVAILILAGGVATQAARAAARRGAGFDRLVRLTLPPMLALVALMGLGLNGWRDLQERRAVGALPPARAGAPNVLLIILDTVRSASLSLHGYERRTSPSLEALGTHGVVFDWAFATAPWTLPSHASVFTGLWTHEHGATWHTPLGDSPRTLAEALAERGYRTGGFVANLTFTTTAYGLNRGFARYEDYGWTAGELAMNSPLASTIVNRPELRRLVGHYDGLSRPSAQAVSQRMLDWLDEDRSRPYFAFINYFEAHDPYLPKPPFDTLFGPVEVRRNERIRLWKRGGGILNKNRLPPDVVEGMLAAYDGAVAEVDFEVGRLLDSLRARGALENTLVIVTSDHGELFGEHGLFEHAKAPFLPVIHVPLVLSWPGRIPEGMRVQDPISIRDIPASVMAIVDSASAGPRFPGVPLERFWSPGAAAAAGVPPGGELALAELAKDPTARSRGQDAGTERVLSLVRGQWHYMRNEHGDELLFDYRADPAEARNLAKEGAHRATLLAMRAAVDSMIGPGGGRSAVTN